MFSRGTRTADFARLTVVEGVTGEVVVTHHGRSPSANMIGSRDESREHSRTRPLRRLFLFEVNVPFGGNEIGQVPGEASFAGPFHDFTVPCRTGAEKAQGGADAGATQVETVGVPADPDGEVAGDEAIRVGFAGEGEKVKLPVR